MAKSKSRRGAAKAPAACKKALSSCMKGMKSKSGKSACMKKFNRCRLK